jgi:hypothetical protein
MPFIASCESAVSRCVVHPPFLTDTLEIEAQPMLAIDEDKILATIKPPRVLLHPMCASITDPPQFEGSDHANECRP